MKKKYIFLTGTIGTIGGGQIYTRNKVNFLKELGWEVEVFSCCDDEIMIDELRCFKKNIMRELKYRPKCFSKEQTDKIIEKIVSEINKDVWSEVIIESHEIKLSLWGELIANKLKCKHFIYLLSESFPKLSLDMLRFFDFKHKRRELVGIHKKSLELLFNGYKDIEENERYSLRAVCGNSVDDVPNPIIDNIEKKDINIGCISRLQKSFVSTMIDEVIYFSKRNNAKTIQLILVGGSPGNLVEQDIIKKTENIGNLNLVMTGRLFPIPRNLFKLVDIFICVAGSAGVSANEGVLTLTVDVETHKPIGLLGYDTRDTLYVQHKAEADISISDALETILVNKRMQKEDIKINYKIADFRKVYPSHLDFVYNSDKENIYYDIFGIRLGIKDFIKKCLMGVAGINLFEKFTSIRNRFILTLRGNPR